MKEKLDVMAEDRETVINYSQCNIGDWAEVYSTDKVIMRRYEKFCEQHPEYCKLIREDEVSMTFSVHPKCASLFPHAPRQVKMSDERKQILRDHLASLRNK